MKISVVVPLHNKGPHIKETLQSIFAQDYQPVEVLVVDDASSDNGLALVEALSNPLVRVIKRDMPGPGGYAARNEGIMAAQGEWIAFIDADDLWEPDHLSSLSRIVELAPGDIGCAFSHSDELRGTSRTPIAFSSKYLASHRPLTANDLLSAWLDTKLCPIWTGAVMIRRDILIEAGLFPAGKALRGGDKDLWLRVFMITKSAAYNKVTAHFRHDAVNRVTKTTKHNSVPILVETIKKLRLTAPSKTSALLLKLMNQEIALYARYTVGGGERVNRLFLSAMHWRGGVKSMAVVAGLLAFGPAIAVARRRLA